MKSWWYLSLVFLASILAISSGEALHNEVGETLPKASRGAKFGANEDRAAGGPRDSKLLSLFSVVQFKNDGCRTGSALTGGGNRNGTCFTSSECAAKGGTASGSCAAGFGVCCLFTISTTNSKVTQNCTYIRNPSFPSNYAESSPVTYTVTKCSPDVCAIRLDFETFSIRGTSATTELLPCQDTFTVTSSSLIPVPVICGQNTGDHIYVDLGVGDANTATLAFAFNGASASRLWEIKVTQVPCKGYNSPPQGCLQYQTGLSGRIRSFNFIPTDDNHLPNQRYSSCIRQEKGFCCIEYTTCANVADGSAMSLSMEAAAKIDSLCTLDYIVISGASSTCAKSPGTAVTSKFCGKIFSTTPDGTVNSPICDCSAPFSVDIVTNAVTDVDANAANTVPSRGVCLDWKQIPC